MNKYRYSKDSFPNIYLYDAGNHPISISGEGTLQDSNGVIIQDHVFISNDIDYGGGLLSGPCMRKNGYTAVIPSVDSSPDIDIIVHDRNGKVVMVENQDFIIDTDKIGSYNHQIVPAEINNIIDITYHIDAVDGFNSSCISELVRYIQQCLHTTKDRTMWLAAHITNFPVSSEQIKRYWKEDMCWINRYLRLRKIDSPLFVEVKETKKKKKASQSDPSKALDTRNLKIG